MDYEVKAESLEDSFAAIEAGGVPRVIERPMISGASPDAAAKAAFVDGYLRCGSDGGLKSFNAVTGGDGGFALPREIDAVIDATLKSISPIRSIANLVRVGSAGYRKLVTQNGVASGWAAENATRPETATPLFNEIVPPMGDLYANPSASQAMLDDAAFDVEGWLAGEIATEFAKAEGSAFVNGNGVNKPKGFLTFATASTPDATRPFGTLQHIASGAAGDFIPTNPQDRLVDLVQALRAPYRQGAVWVMNSATLARIRKFKTSDGAFIWQPSLSAGTANTLLGYPVIESEDMPDIAGNSLSIAFGNFSAGYLIAERSETNILRDPFTNKPFVNFYATKRIGGTVSNSEAIKLMRFAVS
jgi:HK97 family phage major capsid protein